MLEKAFLPPSLNFTACSRSFSSPIRYSCSYTIKFPRVSAKFSRISHFSPMQLILYALGKCTIQPEVFSTCFLLEVRESTFQIAIYSFKRSIPPVSPISLFIYSLKIPLLLSENIFVHNKNLLNSNEYIYLEIIYNKHEFFCFCFNIIKYHYIYIFYIYYSSRYT